MAYVDGYVLVVPKANIEAYRKIAETAKEVWKDHGALEYKECVAEDLSSHDMCGNFIDMTGAKEDETVVFSYIVFKDRVHRDEVNAKVMEDPRIKDSCGDATGVFDTRRMAWGGFTPIVSY